MIKSSAEEKLPASPAWRFGAMVARGRRWLFRLTMRQVFVMAVAAALVLPGVLFTLLTLEWRQAELTRDFHKDQERILETLALGLRQPLWDLSMSSGKPLVDTVIKDERIVSVRVDGNLGGFIAVNMPARQHGNIIRLSSPILYGSQEIGHVIIEFDDGDLRTRLRDQAREYSTMIAVELIASLLLILFLLDSRFLQPLRLLSEQARSLADESRLQPFVWTRADEIGDLGRQLEWARSELHRLITELGEKNEALEFDIIERMQAEAALRASESKYRELFLSNLDAICVVDLDGKVVDANPAMLSLLAEEHIVGKPFASYVREDWRAYDDHMMRFRVMVDGYCGEYEVELAQPRGQVIAVSVKGVLMHDVDSRPIGVLRIMRDLTERKAAAARMELAAKVFDNTAEGIMVVSPSYDLISVNRSFCEITGYSPEEVVGQPLRILRNPAYGDEGYDHVREQVLKVGEWRGELPLKRKNGEVFTASMQINVARDVTGRIGDLVTLIRDISEAKAAEARILHLARFDALTQLPNRAYFRELTEEAISEGRRHKEHCAIVFVDLDHFKTVNDSLGHAIGDMLLQEVARRLAESLRAGDVVGRLGGDEFVMLLHRIDQDADISIAADRLLARLAQPFALGEHELIVTPSLGIAVFPNDGEDYDTLIRNADAAMYHAKALGRNTYRFYTADMNKRAREILAVENQLRRALERKEFVLHYQPQVDMANGELIGGEALIRWQHPERGLLGPAEFIPLAEERGLIGAIGQWVLDEACRQNKAWQSAGLPSIEIAVNLSAVQFYQRDLVDEIAGVLARHQLAARWLVLEVTESVIVQDVESTIATMAALKQMGLKLAIDDFGTGYSSLSYLKRFKADKLKVDRSFVADVPADPDDSAITRAIINLARNLNLKVIAEGVETQAQWDFLREEGCDEVQGFLINRPMPAEAFAAILASGEGWHPSPAST